MAKASNGTNGWLGRVLLIAALTLISSVGLYALQRNEVVHDAIIERVSITEVDIAVVKQIVTMTAEDVRTLKADVKTLLERN